MKRVLALLSVSCGLGLVGWGVGGCGSGVATTTDDGFPLLGASYRLVSDVSETCALLFGERVAIGIEQTSDQLTIAVGDLDTFETYLEASGTTDKKANITFSGTSSTGLGINCTSAAVLEGADKEDVTLPLSCSFDDALCEITYAN